MKKSYDMKMSDNQEFETHKNGRRLSEETIEDAAAEWRTTFDSMPDAVMIIDQDFNIVRANKAASELLELPFSEIIGKPCYQCVHNTDGPPEFCPNVRTHRDGKTHSEEICEPVVGRYLAITTNPLPESPGNPAGSVHVIRDITDQKLAEEAIRNASLQTLEVLSQLIEADDPYTAGHSQRVTELSLEIAREIGVGEKQIETLTIAGYLHDLGKVGILDSVLNKPTRLTQAEQVMIQSHPVLSADTCARVAAFKTAIPIIRHHHEKWDGTGYPDHLQGENIPLLARILAVADSYDAMTSERPYRRRKTDEEAFMEFERDQGSQWDPDLVQVFLNIKKFRRENNQKS